MGVTVAELNGYAPSSITLDTEGNVISVTVSEPRFRPEDLELLLLSRRREHVPVNDLGIPLVEAMDAANQFRYKAVGPRTDWAADSLRRATERYSRDNPGVDMSALRWGVEKV